MEDNSTHGVALAEARTAPKPEARAGRPAVPPSHIARFSVLYQQQHPRVVAFARRRLSGDGAAEDCAAEVFRIAWERVVAGEPVPTAGWLFVTARHVLANGYRADARALETRRRFGDELEIQARELLSPDVDPVAERVVAALERLPGDQRELLIARYWDDLTGAELAALVGCSVGAVWVRLHRARVAFREFYSAKEES
jgi:RNA polymerase sigma-70 factor (ECF subfamily)